MKRELKEKLETFVGLMDDTMFDWELDIEYCIPEVATTSDQCDLSGDPYILVKFAEDNYVDRKIRLTDKYLHHSPQEMANQVTFSVEQFQADMGSIRYVQE
ncbi:MAG: hypothetical protein OEW60_08755 [Thiovulaceae bacterium]|nr:hypothetical protein [Sulfurimonadaceae bacterium]